MQSDLGDGEWDLSTISIYTYTHIGVHVDDTCREQEVLFAELKKFLQI